MTLQRYCKRTIQPVVCTVFPLVQITPMKIGSWGKNNTINDQLRQKKNPSFFQKFSPSRMKITFFVYSLFASDETFLPKCRDYSSSIHARWTAEKDSNTASQRDIITKEDKSQHSWSPWQRLPRHLHMLFIARSVSVISFLSEGRRVSNQKPEKIRNRIFRFVHDQM